MNQKRRARKDAKRKKRKQRAEAFKSSPVELVPDNVYATDKLFWTNFKDAMTKDKDRVRKMFWDRWPNWYEQIRKHIRLGGPHRITRQAEEYFRMKSPHTLANVITEVLCDHYPRYAGFNYAIEVYPGESGKLLHYDIELAVLETRSTRGGIIHMLPNVIFPSNKPVGVTTHAIERMSTRVLTVDGEQHPLGGSLRCKLVFIPYSTQHFGMYLCGAASSRCLFNQKPAPSFALLGYVALEEQKRHFVAVTSLAPGFRQTPERFITQEQMGDYRLLTILDGKVYRALTVGKDTRPNLSGIKKFDAVPYELKHPNIELLTRFGSLL